MISADIQTPSSKMYRAATGTLRKDRRKGMRRKRVLDIPSAHNNSTDRRSKDRRTVDEYAQESQWLQEALKTTPKPQSEDRPADLRALRRQKCELQLRAHEMEYEQNYGQQLAADEDDGTNHKDEVINVLHHLEAQMEKAHALQEALKKDLGNSKASLNELCSSRKEMEARISVYESKAVLADHLKEQIPQVEAERHELSEKLRNTELMLERSEKRREELRVNTKQLCLENSHKESGNIDLEEEVGVLKKRMATLPKLRETLQGLRDDNEGLRSGMSQIRNKQHDSFLKKEKATQQLRDIRHIVRKQDDKINGMLPEIRDAQESIVSLQKEHEAASLDNRIAAQRNRHTREAIGVLNEKCDQMSQELKYRQLSVRQVTKTTRDSLQKTLRK
ncbi:MAG: hypothetical protein HQL32_16495 [Planctomycetes bacterium]|nr:hypothetical protein [Planctomycetota bacterium]